MREFRLQSFFIATFVAIFFLFTATMLFVKSYTEDIIKEHFIEHAYETLNTVKLLIEDNNFPKSMISNYLDRLKNSSGTIKAIYIIKEDKILYKSSGNVEKYKKLPKIKLSELKNLGSLSRDILVTTDLKFFNVSTQHQERYILNMVFDPTKIDLLSQKILNKIVSILAVTIAILFILFIFYIYYLYIVLERVTRWSKNPKQEFKPTLMSEINRLARNIKEFALHKEESIKKEEYLKNLMHMVTQINQEMVKQKDIDSFMRFAQKTLLEYPDIVAVSIETPLKNYGKCNQKSGKYIHSIELEALDKKVGKMCIAKKSSFLPEELDILKELAGDLAYAFISNREMEAKERLIYTNASTKLPNLIAYKNDKEEIESGYLMLFDIRNFKEYNSAFGFETGNEILKKCAAAIERLSGEKVYHIFSDLFLIIYRKKSLEEAIELARKIENSFYKESIKIGDLVIDISLKVAIIDIREKFALNKAILTLSNINGHENLMVYEPEKIEDLNRKNIQIYSTIKEAIKNGRVIPYVQPIVDTATKKISHYEVLARIKNSSGEILTPFYFLEYAKRTELYPYITLEIFEKSLEFMQKEPKVKLSFNISYLDIINKKVHESLVSKIKDLELGERLVFEILETEGIKQMEIMTSFIKEIKELGCKIAIDDFGSGYSNFDYVYKLQADYIKIDGSLIKNIDKNVTKIIIKHINELSHEIGFKTVAEFVENEDIYEKIKNMGIDYAQGYYFEKPKPLSKE